MKTNFDERVLSVLEWPLILNELESRCKTSAGKERAISCSALHKDAIVLQHKKITSLKDLSIQGHEMDFGGITNISQSVERCRRESILALEELVTIKNFMRGIIRLHSFLKEHVENHIILREHLEELFTCPKLSDELSASITDDGELSTSRYPILRKLRESINDTRTSIESKLSAMINSVAMEKIIQEKIFTTVNQRYCIMIKSGMKGRTDGTIQDVSASGATFYLEPDSIKPMNDKLLMQRRALESEIEKILTTLSLLIGSFADDLIANIHTAAYLDFLNAATRLSFALKASAPQIEDEPIIDLKQVRHPLLHLMLKDAIIANDIDLGTNYNCLIISGANTGGKTVLLKTIGCAVLLTRMGLHIPASPDSKIGVFNAIFADIGDEQNLQQSLSTYSGQITVINEMLAKADRNSLVLIDEIIVGTNPRQGAAVAQAILEEMERTGCRMMVSTHYSELKELASAGNGFRNASVSFDLDTLRPTYRLIMGLPGVSYAIEIARNYGIKESILNRATELIDSRDLSIEAMLEETQRFKQEMEEERELLRTQRSEAKQFAEQLNEREHKLKVLEQNIKEERGLDFLTQLDTMREQAAEHIRSLQKSSMKEATDIQHDLLNMKEDITTQLKQDKEAALPENVDPEQLSIGQTVYAAPIEKEGIIDSISADLSSAVVVFGGTIKARFPMDSLYEPSSQVKLNNVKHESKKPAARARKPQHGGVIPGAVQTSYNTIDIRGKRVNDALAILDSSLDEMLKNNMDIVFVIHGHGTGALKQAARDHLKMSAYVSDFRQGEYGEGGDGVTVVRMRGN